MSRKGIRKWINNIHLWLGLASGLVLFVVCLSGTVYTFRSEIERWVEADKFYADAAGTQLLSAEEIIAKTETQTGKKMSAIVVPGDEQQNWQVTLKNPEGKKEEKAITVFVNPYSGKIEGQQGGSTSEFFSSVMKLHRWLLLDTATGRIIVGTATIIFVFMIISGLVLWFPSKLRLIKQGLTIRTSANWKRINHDLHNTLGFYSFLILLVMSLTGLCWSFEWYRDGMSSVLGAKVFKGRGEKPESVTIPENRQQRALVSGMLTAANGYFPYTGNLRLTMPASDSTAITVTKTSTGFFAISGSDKIQFDGFTGKTLKVEKFGDKPLNVQIADSIKALHTGEIFGTFSKIIYFIVCLIATSLPVTGTMIWLNKLKKKPASRMKTPIGNTEQTPAY